ncbi:hypothetical protein ACHAQA_007319 [Verticillium albo-atrum]
MSSDSRTSDSVLGLGLGLRYLDLKELDHHDRSESAPADDETTLGNSPPREHVATPPPHISSPSIPSPMSLGHLGIVPLTPLGKQLAASLGRTPGTPLSGSDRDAGSDSVGHRDSAEEEPTTQGSKVQLIQRLTELARKLTLENDAPPDQITLNLLHRRVDDLDRIADGHPPTAPYRPHLTRLPTGSIDERGSFFGSPSSSWMHSRYSSLSLSTKPEPPKAPEPVPKKPDVDSFKIASEAEKLTAELDTLVTNLKARQEESEHIHDLLVTRAERAAQRIIFLQSRLHDLEAELHESDADLSHLRLGLKAIEVQCPRDFLATPAAAELAQSIANWKADYAALKHRRASRRATASGPSSAAATPSREDAPSYQGSVTPSYHGSVAPSYQGSFTPSYQGSITPSYQSSVAPSYQNPVAPSYTGPFVTPTRATFTPAGDLPFDPFPPPAAEAPPETPRSDASSTATPESYTPSVAASSRASTRSVRVRKAARLNGTPRRRLEYGGHNGGYSAERY